jgi:hypothetical protein
MARERKKSAKQQAADAALAEKADACEVSAAAVSKRYSKTSGRRDDAGWERWLAKLKNYKRQHGDCNVPRYWAEDPPLSMWVRTQRDNKRRLDRGDPGERMTAEWAARLTALGFAWNQDDARWEAQLARLAA